MVRNIRILYRHRQAIDPICDSQLLVDAIVKVVIDYYDKFANETSAAR